MATINCVNQITSPAVRGQSVWVSLNANDTISVLPVLAVNQLVTNQSNSVTGYIDFVDRYGHQFRVKPVAPNKQFNSGTGATSVDTLNSSELLTVTY